MSNEESTQPFNINENTGEPSHRPEHDLAREKVDDKMNDPGEEPLRPEDVSGTGPQADTAHEE